METTKSNDFVYKNYKVSIRYDENFDYWYATATRPHLEDPKLRPELIAFEGPDADYLSETIKKYLDKHR